MQSCCAALASLAADDREHRELGETLASVESIFAARATAEPENPGRAPDLLGIGIGLVANGFRLRR